MPLTDDELGLAKSCYGYGRWGAKYWFIGIEERLDTRENGDRTTRAEAFRKLNTDGLCDCREFHQEIQIDGWETELQPTWRRLIWLLKKYLKDLDDSQTSLLNYQRESWGNAKGDTCVTELSGLPSDSSVEGRRLDHERFKDCKAQFKEIRTRRIENLSGKIEEHNPKLVIFYGKTQLESWERSLNASCISTE
jgi:hypothetical protein